MSECLIFSVQSDVGMALLQFINLEEILGNTPGTAESFIFDISLCVMFRAHIIQAASGQG